MLHKTYRKHCTKHIVVSKFDWRIVRNSPEFFSPQIVVHYIKQHFNIEKHFHEGSTFSHLQNCTQITKGR